MRNETKKRNGLEAAAAYTSAKNDIANLIGWIQQEIRIPPEAANWSHAGTMKNLRQQMIDALKSITGMTGVEIEEALDEMRD